MNIFPSQPSKQYSTHLVFSKLDANEEFLFPLKKYELSQSELKKLKDHFSVYYNVKNKPLKVN